MVALLLAACLLLITVVGLIVLTILALDLAGIAVAVLSVILAFNLLVVAFGYAAGRRRRANSQNLDAPAAGADEPRSERLTRRSGAARQRRRRPLARTREEQATREEPPREIRIVDHR